MKKKDNKILLKKDKIGLKMNNNNILMIIKPNYHYMV